jgi:hypothetical protein
MSFKISPKYIKNPPKGDVGENQNQSSRCSTYYVNLLPTSSSFNYNVPLGFSILTGWAEIRFLAEAENFLLATTEKEIPDLKPTRLLSNVNRGTSSDEGREQRVQLTIHVRLVPRLRMQGAIPPLVYIY